MPCKAYSSLPSVTILCSEKQREVKEVDTFEKLDKVSGLRDFLNISRYLDLSHSLEKAVSYKPCT
ncbi:hypothetical protein CLV24_1442 [Pontibacter ummariensis]|uniref:Uncharacterized protein n=1 Tax=Pontibacter ummariensis TaxID=1610492 RepID=A0A239LNM0_9BACT|nr:hypothetical protein CLV24_1442 [Pontibacter ummariensis]SNT31413.1 hypothetical protein SAMN06296052_1452 [Pontibacter ummariensis]